MVILFSDLLQNPCLSDGAFDWLKTLKYHMDIRSVLLAKTEPGLDRDDTEPQSARSKGENY